MTSQKCFRPQQSFIKQTLSSYANMSSDFKTLVVCTVWVTRMFILALITKECKLANTLSWNLFVATAAVGSWEKRATYKHTTDEYSSWFLIETCGPIGFGQGVCEENQEQRITE